MLARDNRTNSHTRPHAGHAQADALNEAIASASIEYQLHKARAIQMRREV